MLRVALRVAVLSTGAIAPAIVLACIATPVSPLRPETGPLTLSAEATTPSFSVTASRVPAVLYSSTFPTPIEVAAPSSTPFLQPPPAGKPALIPILMYHHLKSLGQNPSKLERDWTVNPETFSQQLDYLQSQAFHTIHFRDLIDFFVKGTPLPARPIILTFDDGWIDDYNVAFPELERRNMAGTFFVPTYYADAGGKSLLDWTQILEMDAAGMEFGGHTLNHADLKAITETEAIRQLQASKAKMEQKLGHATFAFAYPFGSANPAILNLVKEVGYQAAVGLCCGYRLRASSLLLLPRIRISYDDSMEDFVKKLPPEQ